MTFDTEFDRVWPWLEKAVRRYGPTHEKEHVKQRIMDGRAQLWTDPDAAIVTSIEVYDTGFKEVHGWLAGGSMDGVLRLEQRAAKWAKDMGCQRVLLVSRKGFKRTMPGYRETAVMLVKDL